MKFDLRSERRDGYIFMVAAGAVTVESLLQMAHTIRQECEAAQCRGVVIDCDEMSGALSPGTIYFTTQEFIKTVGTIRVAYINTPSHWAQADDEFSRNVAQNRGGELEAFASEQDAVRWIKSDRGSGT